MPDTEVKTADTPTPPTVVTEEVVTGEAQAKALGIPYLSALPKDFDKALLNLISEDTAEKYGMVPFRKEGTMLYVAMLNPQNFEALNVLRFLAEKERLGIEVYMIDPKVFEEIMKLYTGTDSALSNAIQSLKQEDIAMSADEE
ncbi:MAG: hypothetical protein AAB519_04185, partial [Patescibacteria group bacterium]